ncbi:hypothetical protein YC2023_109391 [Brassica napus]
MQLPIRLHDTKDAAETAKVKLHEKQATEPTRESSLKAVDAITWVILKTPEVDIESSKESQSNYEKHAMVDVSEEGRYFIRLCPDPTLLWGSSEEN